MMVRRAAEVRVEMTGVVSGFRRFCITIRPTNTRSHSTTSLCGCGGGGRGEGGVWVWEVGGNVLIERFSMSIRLLDVSPSLATHRMTLSALCHGMCIVL